ncbi:MAG: aminotransferase class V-fold PLP-dependent enzyme [Thermincolia bacterium]
MIYLDNAATTWPKPPGVWPAMEHCFHNLGANPGRSGHQMALDAGRLIYETRDLLGKLFHINNPLQIVFTLNATEAINLALKGFLKPGDHVITSSMEHNAVTRPLHVLSTRGVEVTKVKAVGDGQIKVEDVVAQIRDNTKVLVFTHASNVTGTLMPIEEIGQLAKSRGLIFMVDAAQTAGVYDIDVEKMKIDLLAFPGHKSLYGPQGTGGLYIREGIILNPLKEGGTGSSSEHSVQPDVLPDRYESGTPNTIGIAGLGAAVKFLLQQGLDKIRAHEEGLTKRFLQGVESIPGVIVYGPRDVAKQAPVVSVNFGDHDSSEVGFILDRVFNIACRTGLHCAPDAHDTLGTLGQGTVRFSFSYFTKEDDIDAALDGLQRISQELK